MDTKAQKKMMRLKAMGIAILLKIEFLIHG